MRKCKELERDVMEMLWQDWDEGESAKSSRVSGPSGMHSGDDWWDDETIIAFCFGFHSLSIIEVDRVMRCHNEKREIHVCGNAKTNNKIISTIGELIWTMWKKTARCCVVCRIFRGTHSFYYLWPLLQAAAGVEFAPFGNRPSPPLPCSSRCVCTPIAIWKLKRTEEKNENTSLCKSKHLSSRLVDHLTHFHHKKTASPV